MDMVLHLCQFCHNVECLNIVNPHRAATQPPQIQQALKIYKKGYGYTIRGVP